MKKKTRTTVASLEKRVDLQRKSLDDHNVIVHRLGQRYSELKGRMENQRLELDELADYKQALGPLWKTQAGHRMPITLLSTSHLQRLSSGSCFFCNGI